jgi:hypothetical protein
MFSNHRLRTLLLILAPLPIVAVSLVVSRWARCEPLGPLSENQAIVRGASASQQVSVAADSGLENQCQMQAEALAAQLGPGCETLARPPFVLGGNMTADELDGWYRRTIAPATRAMARMYFRQTPSAPITVLLFGDEAHYTYYARQLFGEEGISVYGYYRPNTRTLITNIETGSGTLVHELTHALVDFDFPGAPDWLNEGLASLHEACTISDERGIRGGTNWRLPGLQQAMREGRLPSLEQLVSQPDFRGHSVGLNYAQARYFCLYLQEQGLLERFYDRFRHARDPEQPQARQVQLALGGANWPDLDARFRDWVLSLGWQRSSARSPLAR